MEGNMIRTEEYVNDGGTLYVVKDIRPKNGRLREIHECMLGRLCSLDGLEHPDSNGRPTILSETGYDPGYMHSIHLSPVVSVNKDGDVVTVNTENTVYVFELKG